MNALRYIDLYSFYVLRHLMILFNRSIFSKIFDKDQGSQWDDPSKKGAMLSKPPDSKISDTELKPLGQRLMHQAVIGSFMAAVELLLLGQICDRIRIYQQTEPQVKTIRQSIVNLYKKGGLREFYVGTGFNLLSHCGKHALRWCLIMPVDNFWKKMLPDYPVAVSIMSGMSFALIETTLVKCPAESMKTKKMTNLSNESIKAKLFSKGPKVLFSGWSAMLFRQVVSWISFRLAVDQTTRFFLITNKVDELSMNQTLIVAVLSGLINVLAVCPFDSVTTQLQKDGGLPFKGYIPAWRYIYKRYGLRVFYMGWQVKFIRSSWYALLFQLLMNHFNKYQRLEE